MAKNVDEVHLQWSHTGRTPNNKEDIFYIVSNKIYQEGRIHEIPIYLIRDSRMIKEK